MRFFVLFFSIFMTSACSNNEQSAAFQTASGWPEIEINTKSKQAVVDNLIHRNVSNGWSLESESPSLLVFSFIDSSGTVGSAFTQVLLGNANSTPPKYEARYVITMLGEEKVKVIVNAYVSTQMLSGQTRSMPLSNNKDTFDMYQAQLNRVKKEIEVIK